MANGTIAFDTLSTSGQITGTAKSVDTDYVVNGSAKVVSGFNIHASEFMTIANNSLSSETLNVSSGTDRGTGLLTVSLTSAMNTRQYIFIGGVKATNNTHTLDDASTTSAVITQANDADSNDALDQATYLTIHGDLA